MNNRMLLLVRIGSVGLLVLGLLVSLIIHPEYFTSIIPALIVIIGVGTYINTSPLLRLSDVLRGVYALILPSIATFFFIDVVFWQYVVAGLVSWLVIYYIKLISQGKYTWGSAVVIIPMIQASVSSVIMLGLGVYFNIPWWLGAIGVVLLIALFPGAFRSSIKVPMTVLDKTPKLFTTQVSALHTLMWHVIPTQTYAHAHRFLKFVFGRKIMYVLRLKVYAILALSEVYIVVAMLPISVLVGAAIISLTIACLALLMNYHDYGLMRGVIVKRYVGVCVAMVLVILLTAQLS